MKKTITIASIQMFVHRDKNKNIEQLKKLIDQISFLKKIRLNIAIEHDNQSFLKLKIKIRKKIVADGLKNKDYSFDKNGIHVNAKEFNKLLENQNTITIDMRNHYESEIGQFEGANLPDVDSFRESLPIINEKFNNDKNLALRLLFSEKLPKSKQFNQIRSSIIDRNICE